MNEGYTIKEYIQEMDKRHTERLDAIYKEVKKTNGRVRELEKWRSWLTGAIAFAIAIGIPDLIAIATGNI